VPPFFHLFPEGHNNNNALSASLLDLKDLIGSHVLFLSQLQERWYDFSGRPPRKQLPQKQSPDPLSGGLWAALPQNWSASDLAFSHPQTAKSVDWGCARASSLREPGRRGPGSNRRWQRAERAADRAQLAARPWAAWQGEGQRSWARNPSWLGLPNSRCVGAVLRSRSLATPALSSSRCARKHPPAPGNSQVGCEPLTWAKNCAASSAVPPLRSPPHFRPSYEAAWRWQQPRSEAKPCHSPTGGKHLRVGISCCILTTSARV